VGYDLSADRDAVGRLVATVKERENLGYTYEAADASFELLLRDEVNGNRNRFFELESWRTISEQRADGSQANEATVKLHVQGERIIATGEGNGPVNAPDMALRAALARFYPQIAAMELVDYKVRILEGQHGTTSRTRVLITTSDGKGEWATVGVGENVIAASWQALDDAYTYGLIQAGLEP
jgi:2-isopropylmalate synthase